VTRAKIGSLLENFKIDLLSTSGTQVDLLKAKKKQQEEKQTMSVFCLKCRKKHLLRECPLESIHVCGLCIENHITDDCPTLKELQACQIEETQGFYYMAPRSLETMFSRYISIVSSTNSPTFSISEFMEHSYAMAGLASLAK